MKIVYQYNNNYIHNVIYEVSGGGGGGGWSKVEVC